VAVPVDLSGRNADIGRLRIEREEETPVIARRNGVAIPEVPVKVPLAVSGEVRVKVPVIQIILKKITRLLVLLIILLVNATPVKVKVTILIMTTITTGRETHYPNQNWIQKILDTEKVNPSHDLNQVLHLEPLFFIP